MFQFFLLMSLQVPRVAANEFVFYGTISTAAEGNLLQLFDFAFISFLVHVVVQIVLIYIRPNLSEIEICTSMLLMQHC